MLHGQGTNTLWQSMGGMDDDDFLTLNDDPNFLHRGNVGVFTDSEYITIPYRHAKTALPRLSLSSGFVSIRELARKLAGNMKSRHAPLDVAETVLMDLFRDLKHSFGNWEVPRLHIYRRLKHDLARDVKTSQHRGFYLCRRRFVTLAAFSKGMQSSILAKLLRDFFMSIPQIILHDPSQFLIRWGLALMDMKQVLGTSIMCDCFRALATRLHDIASELIRIEYLDRRIPELNNLLVRAASWNTRPRHVDDFGLHRGRDCLRPALMPARHTRSMPPAIMGPPPAHWEMVAAPAPSLHIDPWVPQRPASSLKSGIWQLNERMAGVEDKVDLLVGRSLEDHAFY